MNYLLRFTIALSIASLAACSSSKTNILLPNAELPHSVAVLPQSYPADVARERVDYLRNVVRAELKNRGFNLLEDRIVNKVCKDPSCPEKDLLSSKHGANGFLVLDVRSLSQNSFIAGFVNILTGTLVALDRSGAKILEVEHTESERGGVLFDSGQVIQGVSDQVQNSGDQAFNRLANKFSTELVELLPETKTKASLTPASLPALLKLNTRWLPNNSIEVCAEGITEGTAYLVFGKERIPLRSSRPTEQCSAFSGSLIGQLVDGAFVELRSSFGDAMRQKIVLDVQPPCDLTGQVKVIEEPKSVVLTVNCPVNAPYCTSNTCTLARTIIFRAASDSGAFRKVGETLTRSWRAKIEGANQNNHLYQVVGLNSRGQKSLPAEASR